MVFYSRGIFHFRPPFDHIGQFSDLNIAKRIVNVELDYEIDARDFSITDTERLRSFKATTLHRSLPHGPAAIFTGNDIERSSAVIKLRFGISDWWKYATMICSSPLFDALKQLTGFRTVALKVEVIIGYCHEAALEKEWHAWLTPLLNEFRVSLEPALGHGAMSEPESLEDWRYHSSRQLAMRPVPRYYSRQLVFHPRDHLTEMAKMNNTMTRNEEQVVGAGSDHFAVALPESIEDQTSRATRRGVFPGLVSSHHDELNHC